MHMDRLIKLVPTVLELPSSVDAKARAELVRETVMQPVLKPYRVQARHVQGSSRSTLLLAKKGGISRANMYATKHSLAAGSMTSTLEASQPSTTTQVHHPLVSRNRPSAVVLSLGPSRRYAPSLGPTHDEDSVEDIAIRVPPSPKPPGRQSRGSGAAPAPGSDANARAGRAAGDSEARKGQSILAAVKLNLRHSIGIDGAGDPINPSEPPAVTTPHPPPGEPGPPIRMRTLGLATPSGLMHPHLRPQSQTSGASVVLELPSRPAGMPAPPSKTPSRPPDATPPRPPPDKKPSPKPPPPPAKEDKDAHLKKTAADVDMSAMLNASSSDGDDSDASESGSDSD
jgi:hypothetical protein